MFDYSDDEDAESATVASGPSQGQQLPTRHSQMVQANAGYGSSAPYNPASYPMAPLGGAPDGIGAYSTLYNMPTPGATRSGVLGTVMNGSPLFRGLRAVSGLGDDAAATPATATTAGAVQAASGILVAAVALGLVATAIGSYYVGKAVAPSRDKETSYAWWGVGAGLLLGPIGLGIEAAVALNHKGR